MSQSLSASLIKAKRGQYSVAIRNTMREAWRRIKGLKKSFFIASVVFFLILVGMWFVLQCVLMGLVQLYLYKAGIVVNFISNGVLSIFAIVCSTGFTFLALQHVRGQLVNYSAMFFKFGKIWQPLLLSAISFWLLDILLVLVGKMIVSKFYILNTSVFTYIKPVLIVILFMYINLLNSLSMLLILDKALSFRESVSVAFTAINHHVIKIMALMLITEFLFVGITFLTLGIGLIWFLPFTALILAILYQRIFCQSEPESSSVNFQQ